MKTQNVYIGQRANIKQGAVYSSIHEAVKELLRPMQAGMVFDVTFLPDAPRYWIVGMNDAAAKYPDLRYNQIFCGEKSDAAEQHAQMLIARGFPKSMVIFKELPIVTKGPDTIDIKTEEHFQCERELASLRRKLELGIAASNFPSLMPVIVDVDAVKLSPGYALVKEDVAGFSEIDTAGLWDNVKTAASLLAQMAEVDQEQSPRKWKRLQGLCKEFGQLHGAEVQQAIDAIEERRTIYRDHDGVTVLELKTMTKVGIGEQIRIGNTVYIVVNVDIVEFGDMIVTLAETNNV